MTAAIEVLDSITKLQPAHRGCVVIAASHGGVYAGYCAAAGAARAVILNNAGVGRDAAGIGALDYLAGLDMAAATIDHNSARIGDGADMAARGIVSHANPIAAALGVGPGMTVREAAERLTAAAQPGRAPEPYQEARSRFDDGESRPRVWGLDSASLLRDDDAGDIVITASHGALLGGQPDAVSPVPVFASAFNDAGMGADRAGISRLPALERRGIPAFTVAADSARIGDARSSWETGRLSALNGSAARAGLAEAMTVQEAVARLLRTAEDRER